MRFARMSTGRLLGRLVDAQEYGFPLEKLRSLKKDRVQEFLESFKVIKYEDDYEKFPLRLCYGVFLPNPELDGQDVVAHIERWKDHRLMTFHWTTTFTRECETVLLQDIIVIGRLDDDWPFAALVRSRDAHILTDADGGVSYFIRYEDLDPVTNLLNRPGIFFFKEVRDTPAGDLSGEWKSFIEEDRVLKAGRRP